METAVHQQYSMKVPPFTTKLCVFSVLFTLRYMFRPISRPSSGGTFIEYCCSTRNRMQNQKIKCALIFIFWNVTLCCLQIH
jgi:hypothetical protein